MKRSQKCLAVETLECRTLMSADMCGALEAAELSAAEAACLISAGQQVAIEDVAVNLPGNIADGSQAQVFRLSATAGTTYVIETSLGTLSDTVMSVYDSDGRAVALNDDFGGSRSSRIELTPSENGTYFVEVVSYSASQSGSYSLRISAESQPRGGAGMVSANPIGIPRVAGQLDPRVVNNAFEQVAATPIGIPQVAATPIGIPQVAATPIGIPRTPDTFEDPHCAMDQVLLSPENDQVWLTPENDRTAARDRAISYFWGPPPGSDGACWQVPVEDEEEPEEEREKEN